MFRMIVLINNINFWWRLSEWSFVMSFIGTLAVILVATTVFGHLSVRLGMPAVIGQLISGIIIGPAILGIIQPDELVVNFAEIGIILLMFIAGIESDLQQLRKFLKPALLVATCGVIFPIFVMGTFSLFFSYHFQEALFIGAVFSATSVSISIVGLREFRSLNTKEGTTILGAAVADDIMGVIILSLLISLENSSAVDINNLIIQLTFQCVFFIGVFFLVRWIAPILMHFSEKLLIPTNRTISAMIICLLMAYIAETVGLSGAIGAFFAGIAVGQTNSKKVVVMYIEPIGNAIFIPVFFVNIGLGISFSNSLTSLIFIITMTLLAILTKWFGGYLGSILSGFTKQSSNIVGAGMVARGEMALITAQIGYNAHFIQKELYIDLIFIIVLATIIAPLLLRWSLRQKVD